MGNNLNNATELELLQAKLNELGKVTEQMKGLIQERTNEIHYFKDILFALDFVDFSRKLYYEDCDYTYYDYISVNMDRYRDANVRTRAVRLVDNRNIGRKSS